MSIQGPGTGKPQGYFNANALIKGGGSSDPLGRPWVRLMGYMWKQP